MSKNRVARRRSSRWRCSAHRSLTANPFFHHLLIMVLFWTLLGARGICSAAIAGQVSFGHAAFLGVGAYATMLLHLKLGWSPWLGMLVGGASARSWPFPSA